MKKISNEAKLEDEALRTKFSLDLDLVAENKDDARVAELMQYSTVECKFILCLLSHYEYIYSSKVKIICCSGLAQLKHLNR